jgi:hypothetical protein
MPMKEKNKKKIQYRIKSETRFRSAKFSLEVQLSVYYFVC